MRFGARRPAVPARDAAARPATEAACGASRCRVGGSLRRTARLARRSTSISSWPATETASCFTSPPSSLISPTTVWMRSCAGRIGRHHAALDGGEPASEFGDLAREVGGAARQIGDLAADVGAVAQPHRHGVVEDQEGQRGQRHDGGFRAADAGQRIQHQAERRCDQHHADGDENRRYADHMRATPPRRASLAPS